MAERMNGNTAPYTRLSRVYDLDWANFAMQYLNLIPPLLEGRGIERAQILDLACGTGSLAIALAKHGHEVRGIDLSPEMIALAREKALSIDNVSFETGDMTVFRADDKLDIILCTFDSINYLLELAGVQALFRQAASVLDPDGLFVFDANTANMYLNNRGESYRRELGGQTILQRCDYDPKRGIATTTFEFDDGRVEIHHQRPYNMANLEPMLNDAGLYIVYAFGGFDKQPYTPESERLICVAEPDTTE
jgi:SAM-dependent methyltransferase